MRRARDPFAGASSFRSRRPRLTPRPALLPSSAKRLRRLSRGLALFAAQTALWAVIAVAFATLIDVAGWARWSDALYFSAINWLPWAVLGPLVFWLARRFPVERARWPRSVPIHLLACAGCIVLVFWLSALLSPARRPPGSPRTFSIASDGRAPDARLAEKRDRPADASAAEPRPAEPGRGGAAPAPAAGSAPPGERPPADRREHWVLRAAGERKEGGRWSGERGGPGFARPVGPAADSVPGILRRWAFLGSFWPPFGGALLRANFTIAVYMIIACLAHALGYYRRAQQRERQALTLAAGLNQAKLDALRLQLQPHFLFNTLHAISALVHRNPDAADELIADLSELLRLSLQSTENEVPLSRELELLDCYLAIERTRLGDRLRVERSVDPDVLNARVPTFILQPLAENAVRHGIEPRRDPGTLAISARRLGDDLHLLVKDDGVGLKATATEPSRRGIGLANARERLRALHGPRARLTLLAPDTGGVQVEIVLPLRPAAAAPVPAAS